MPAARGETVSGLRSPAMRLACAAAALLLLAACSSSPPAKFTTKPGVAALDIARHVKDCTNVQQAEPELSASSAATCTLKGHQVQFYGWATRGKHPLSSVNATGGSAYAWGPGWSAILTESGSYGLFYSAALVVADDLDGTVSS